MHPLFPRPIYWLYYSVSLKDKWLRRLVLRFCKLYIEAQDTRIYRNNNKWNINICLFSVLFQQCEKNPASNNVSPLLQMINSAGMTLSCLLLFFQITRGKMIGKHNFSLHTQRGWKWTVLLLIGLIGEREGASNWRERLGWGYFLALNEPFKENGHHCCAEEKDLS